MAKYTVWAIIERRDLEKHGGETEDVYELKLKVFDDAEAAIDFADAIKGGD